MSEGAIGVCGLFGEFNDGGIETLEQEFTVSNWLHPGDTIEEQIFTFTLLKRGMWGFYFEATDPLSLVTNTFFSLPHSMRYTTSVDGMLEIPAIVNNWAEQVPNYLLYDVTYDGGSDTNSWVSHRGIGRACVFNKGPTGTCCGMLCNKSQAEMDIEGWSISTPRTLILTVTNDGNGGELGEGISQEEYDALGIPEFTTFKFNGFWVARASDLPV